MTGKKHDIEEQFDAAVLYAIEIIDDFDETRGATPVAAVLDHIEDEYNRAIQEHRGMDPKLVIWAIQMLLNAAQFPVGNRPDEYDPDAMVSAPSLDAPLFSFTCKAGRPVNERGASEIAFAVGAVVGRFGLNTSRNAEPAPHKPRDGKVSAIDAVVEAQRRRNRTPNSFSGVRNCVERSEQAKDAFEEGRHYGLAEARTVAN